MAADFGDEILESIFAWVKKGLRLTPQELEKLLEWIEKVKDGVSNAELEGDLTKMNFDSPETAQKVKEIADKLGIECEVANSSVVIKSEDFEKLSNEVNEIEAKSQELKKEINETKESTTEKITETVENSVEKSESYLKNDDNLERLYGSPKQFDKDNRVSLDDEIKDAKSASQELANQAKTQVHEKVIDVGEIGR